MLRLLENGEGASLQNNKKILIIILVYFLFNIFIKWLERDQAKYNKIISKIANESGKVTIDDLIFSFEYEDSYEGVWRKLPSEPSNSQDYLKFDSGIFEMRFIKLLEMHSNSYFAAVFYIIDGQYIDDGTIEYQFKCSNKQFEANLISSSLQTLSLKHGTFLDGRYDKDDLFVTKDLGPANASLFNISFCLNENKQLDIKINLQTEHVSLALSVKRESDRLIKTIIFAAIMFFISFGPFAALISIISNITQGLDAPANYSLLTICLTSMWDTVICLVALVYAFSSQENLILFIIPAFLMCLIFTNLQPKLMILIYEAVSNHSTSRSLICRFNLIHYGSLFLIYPFIIITNFNWTFFLFISCLLFPQIYTNAVNGNRPDPTSRYYHQFLLYRFLLVFYVRCCPYNIFRFQPDFWVGASCLFILALQYALICMQKRFGPKKVMPKFMLPSVYNYNCQEGVNLEEGGEAADCSICLTPLHSPPPPSSASIEIEIGFGVMKTPCKHSYHSSCLIEWMRIKQDCPQCRSHLPPYE